MLTRALGGDITLLVDRLQQVQQTLLDITHEKNSLPTESRMNLHSLKRKTSDVPPVFPQSLNIRSLVNAYIPQRQDNFTIKIHSPVHMSCHVSHAGSSLGRASNNSLGQPPCSSCSQHVPLPTACSIVASTYPLHSPCWRARSAMDCGPLKLSCFEESRN